MKFMLLVYNDEKLLDEMPPAQYDAEMRDCLGHADDLRREGHLLESQMLEAPATARSVRQRNGTLHTIDGPFSETKEVLGGFNLIEAEDMDEAVRIAASFPWVRTGCIEVRPVRDIQSVKQHVGHADALVRSG